ncbi:MAG: glycosyltransferase family 4 protein [Chloroflexi bacterium]|nr:glycosyltransferase family 4 protein [Chloroflexota bacterium]
MFLYVGQLIPRKGLLRLLDECKHLLRRGRREFTLVLVGDGSQRTELEDHVRRSGLEENVKMVGWVEYGELGGYFRCADVFVFPTLEDTWGMAVLEAMVMRKPILCSKLAGASELVRDGENGYLFDPYEAGELARLMEMMMDDPAGIQRMGVSSCQIIAPHTPEAAAGFLSDIAQSVAPERN